MTQTILYANSNTLNNKNLFVIKYYLLELTKDENFISWAMQNYLFKTDAVETLLIG